MSNVIQEIALTSHEHFGKRLPPEATGRALIGIPAAVRAAVSMAFRGRSTSQGPRPRWLEAAADLRFLGHTGNDDSILRFEAPCLGDVAAEVYQQGLLWDARPAPSDTGVDLFADVLVDVAAGNVDSGRYDPALLRRLVRFKKVVGGTFQEMRVRGGRYADNDGARLNADVIESAKRLFSSTPAPQRVRLVGTLDMVRASTQSFALRLDDGQDARGVLLTGLIVDAARLLRQRALVLGRAVYRASGTLLRIDADEILPAVDESPIWSSLPPPVNRKLDLAALYKPQGPKSGLAAIIGQWPGDETDEQIESALKELS